MVRETLAGMRPLLCSEDMEVQERAHNATALLSLVLRKLSPEDLALAPELRGETESTLIPHENRYFIILGSIASFDIVVFINLHKKIHNIYNK